MNRRSGSQWVGRDHSNDVPIHFSYPPAPRRSFGYGDHLVTQSGSGLSGGQYNNHFPWRSSQQFSDARFGTRTGTRQFEETTVARPRISSGIGLPFEPYPRRQIVALGSMERETGHRTAPFPGDFAPRFSSQGNNRHVAQDRDVTTNWEQENVMKKLRKEIYSSKPKNFLRRMNLYYRNVPGCNDQDPDEEIKSCAICLEDFEPGVEVRVTPCRHMFHEECIVPWVKSHGQCPVCRFVISEQIKASATGLSSRNTPATLPVHDDPFIVQHLEWFIRALEESTSWADHH